MRSAIGSDTPARLLLIEQDASACSAMMRDLGECLGARAEITGTCSGRDACAELRANRFEIVVADLTSLRDMAALPETAMAKLCRLASGALILALSDGSSVSSAVAAMRAGAHDYIAKPLTGPAFAARLDELHRRHTRTEACDRPAREPAPEPPEILPMWQQEQRIIETAIAHFNGNIAQAAAALEISPSTIYRKRQSWEQMRTGMSGAA